MIAWLWGAGVVFWVCVAALGWLLLMFMLAMFLKVGSEADEAWRELRERDLDEARARWRHPSGSAVRRIPVEDDAS